MSGVTISDASGRVIAVMGTDGEMVPATATPRQMKLAMLGAGLLDNVEAFVAGADRSVQISWEYATEFDRFAPMLNAMAQAFGLTEAQVDDLFRAAATL